MMQLLPDLLILFTGLITALLFVYFGTDRLYRFYFGLILGFLLFLVFNLQIKVIQLSGGIAMSGWEEFLIGNKKDVLSFFILMIPIFGILFSVMNGDLKTNKLFSGLFGFLLPAFLLGIFGYIFLHSSIQFSSLSDFLSFFDSSKIFDILQKAPKILFGLLLMIIFWRYIFAIILTFLGYLAKLIISEINDLKGVEKKRVEKEETKTIKLN